MNFLSLGQRLALECGVSGVLTTMIGQTGSLGRIVNWVGAAWEDVQTAHDDWDWMRSSATLGGGVSVTPAAGVSNVPMGTGAGQTGILVTNFGKWIPDTFRNRVTSVGIASEIHMDPIGFDAWRNGYMFGAMTQVQTRPVVVAFGPDKSLCIGPPTNGLYTITGDYFVAPSVMAVDTDIPFGIPAAFHAIIVAKGMQMYGEYESAQEVLDRGTKWYSSLISRLETTNTPQIGFGGALDQ